MITVTDISGESVGRVTFKVEYRHCLQEGVTRVTEDCRTIQGYKESL